VRAFLPLPGGGRNWCSSCGCWGLRTRLCGGYALLSLVPHPPRAGWWIWRLLAGARFRSRPANGVDEADAGARRWFLVEMTAEEQDVYALDGVSLCLPIAKWKILRMRSFRHLPLPRTSRLEQLEFEIDGACTECTGTGLLSRNVGSWVTYFLMMMRPKFTARVRMTKLMISIAWRNQRCDGRTYGRSKESIEPREPIEFCIDSTLRADRTQWADRTRSRSKPANPKSFSSINRRFGGAARQRFWWGDMKSEGKKEEVRGSSG